ncbi:hypothetical protein [Bacillus thuringiensis]|nr:hypothetical protein [Bacillus thuringiensis]
MKDQLHGSDIYACYVLGFGLFDLRELKWSYVQVIFEELNGFVES